MTADPDPATTAAGELAAYDAAADDPAVRAAFTGLNEHYHAKHHDAEDDASIEVCCVAAMLEAAGFADTYEAYERGRAEARAAERQRWAAQFREMAAEVLPKIGTLSGFEALARSDPSKPAQVQGRLLLDLADLLDGPQ